MKVLITGSSGQLGRLLKEKISNKYIDIFAPASKDFDLKNKIQINKFIKSNKPDWVINCPVFTNVDSAESNEQDAYLLNSEGPKYIVESLLVNGGKLLQISTDYVFDWYTNKPYLTSDRINPLNVYGKSKYLGERNILDTLGYSSRAYILRTSWISSPSRKNFALTILKLFSEKDSVNVVSNQIGCPTNVFSLSDLFWKLITKLSSDQNINLKKPIFNYSDAGSCSWFQLAKEISKIAKDVGLIIRLPNIYPIKKIDYPVHVSIPIFSILEYSDLINYLNYTRNQWRVSLLKMISNIKNIT